MHPTQVSKNVFSLPITSIDLKSIVVYYSCKTKTGMVLA